MSNDIKKKLAEEKRQRARVTFGKRPHKGRTAVKIDGKRIGFYHFISLSNKEESFTGKRSKADPNSYYWQFVDERTDPKWRKDQIRMNHYVCDNGRDIELLQRKIASSVIKPNPPPPTKEEREELQRLNQALNGILGQAFGRRHQ